jgi:hypothetical protein
MDIFDFRNQLIQDYASYIQSFISIRDETVRQRVQESLAAGALWPRPLIQLNPSFEVGESIEHLIAEGVLHSDVRGFSAKTKLLQMDKGEP